MHRPIVVPDLDWPTPVLSVWYVRPGEHVYAGDRVAELLLGAATFDVSAPCSGRLLEQQARPGDPAPSGQVLGYIVDDSV